MSSTEPSRTAEPRTAYRPLTALRFDLGVLGPRGDVRVSAEPDGWWLRPAAGGMDLTRRATWPAAVLATPDGAAAAMQAEVLLDLDIAEAVNGAVRVSWERFADAIREDVALPLQFTRWSPFMLSIDRTSDLTRDDFRYRYEYRLGGRGAPVERVGFFVHRKATGQRFHLDEQTFALVEAMDRFNATPRAERTKAGALLTFATVKGCSEAVGAALDATLRANDVVVPSQLSLQIYEHPEDGSISFVPRCAELPGEAFGQAFLRNTEAEGVYVLDGAGGKRVRVVLSERQRQVLERMKTVRRARGAEKAAALESPASVFDGVLDAVEISYGPRVVGVGDFPFTAVPADPREGGGFFAGVERGEPGAEGGDTAAAGRRGEDRPQTVTLPGAAGEPAATLRFENAREVAAARAILEEAQARGDATVTIQGVTVAVSPEAVAALDRPPVEERGAKGTAGRQFLLIYTNEEDADLRTDDLARATEALARVPEVPFALPKSLRPDVELKAHQMDALRWLQRCDALRPSRRGVLLADDMGLGKTVQILTHLAWLIEQGRLRDRPGQGEAAPWRPILIVAPLILVENETWQSEMRRFFRDDGDIFAPVLALHGAAINKVRAAGATGAETVVGRPVLDADKLMQYRVVVTNYETVVNYQHSLAQLKDGRPLWSAIVTDEAQKFKALNTKISVALKATAADFHIASTGTPVENRLLDLWNIVDTIQPALLGSAQAFSTTYERALGTEEGSAALDRLRQTLRYGQPHAFLLRRSKKELLDMPPKSIVPVPCALSDEERSAHLELLSVLGRERKAGRHLAVLHRLQALYQHPALLDAGGPAMDAAALVRRSGKLRATLETLREIKRRREKAIIFARLIDMQQILAYTIGEEFGIEVPIINGAASRGRGANSSTAGTGRAREYRKRILDDFRAQPGFGALVLSPFVAGIGLTITEANHVFHYGRWWNPAVEGQATDRAYRIGQTKPVSVYLPILEDPTRAIEATFDQLLDRLLRSKSDLADNFLQPVAPDEEAAEQLCDELLGGQAAARSAERPLTAAELAAMDPFDFEAALAALYEAEGHRVVLTAKGNDGGADVIAVRNGEALLVQGKHASGGDAVDIRAVADVLAAGDLYGPRLRARRWAAVIASNAPADRDVVREAQERGVELLTHDRLLKRFEAAGVTRSAVRAVAATRAGNFEDGVRRARDLLRAVA